MSLLDDVDDEAFLLAAEAAEAAANTYSKRPRLSTSPSPTPAASEGSYLSALKGSHSAAWKQQQETLTLAHKRPGGSKVPGVSPGGGVQITKGACFKCGDTSHWARECPQSLQASVGGVGGGIGGGGGGVGGGIGGGGGGYVDAGGEVEEKACPCGAGICLVLTSSTPRNPGRKFYRCPTRDNGGCNFFEWCDAPSPGAANARSSTSFQSDASIVNMPCSCGAGTCLILTTKAGVNVGRQFYRCPAQGGSSCGFFKWCDDQQQPRTAAPLQGGSSPYQAGATPTNQSMSKSSSGCFKCGQENHWAKDCPNQSSDPYSDKGGRALSSATSSDGCFKCGKAGHWSRDCPVANSGGGGGGAVASNVKSSSTLGSWNSRRY
ncbi:uncharacterized protein [Aegilops tauschii subsp. strangulata]|nr:DNA-binding protein HEXBP [Aegilops tauschii subsp. strangulata]XP_044399490.1 DNA-binding protein HEXBP-like [Triticum aestivum]